MPRKPKNRVPSVDVPKKHALERMRRIAAMLKDNPNSSVDSTDLYNYIMSNGDNNPSEVIKVNNKVIA